MNDRLAREQKWVDLLQAAFSKSNIKLTQVTLDDLVPQQQTRRQHEEDNNQTDR